MVGGVHGRGSTWQERRPLQRTVRILLEYILVAFVEIDNLVINLFARFKRIYCIRQMKRKLFVSVMLC